MNFTFDIWKTWIRFRFSDLPQSHGTSVVCIVSFLPSSLPSSLPPSFLYFFLCFLFVSLLLFFFPLLTWQLQPSVTKSTLLPLLVCGQNRLKPISENKAVVLFLRVCGHCIRYELKAVHFPMMPIYRLKWSGFHIRSGAQFSVHPITSEQPKARIVSACFFLAVLLS